MGIVTITFFRSKKACLAFLKTDPEIEEQKEQEQNQEQENERNWEKLQKYN
jgi:heme-degrading monooxygenase HmoA